MVKHDVTRLQMTVTYQNFSSHKSRKLTLLTVQSTSLNVSDFSILQWIEPFAVMQNIAAQDMTSKEHGHKTLFQISLCKTWKRVPRREHLGCWHRHSYQLIFLSMQAILLPKEMVIDWVLFGYNLPTFTIFHRVNAIGRRWKLALAQTFTLDQISPPERMVQLSYR